MCSLSALIACSFLICSCDSLPKDVQQRRVSIRSDRFMARIDPRTEVSVAELLQMLGVCSDATGAKLKTKGPRILNTVTYMVEGKETTRENLIIDVTFGKQDFTIELDFNQSSFLDFDEADYELKMRNSLKEGIDSDRWFDELYKINEKELKDPSELKDRAIDERKEDLLAAYKAFSSKKNVRDLRVFRVLDNYYFVGTKDGEEFLSPALRSFESGKYSISIFVPSKNRGTHSWHFHGELFGRDRL